MEPFHFLYIKTDTPLLALSYFSPLCKHVYNFPCFTSCSFLFCFCYNYHIHLHYTYVSYYFQHFIYAALNIPCTRFQSPVSSLKSSISVWFLRLGVWFFSVFCFWILGEELAFCINPQPGWRGDFWSRFSSCRPW